MKATMSVLVNLQLKVKQGQIPKLLETFKAILPDTRAYKGCHWVKLTTNIDDVNILEIVTEWDSKEHYDTYIQWRTNTGTLAGLLEFLDEAPVFRFLPIEQTY
jgi:quinol monooxygenase YgiN